MAAIVRPLLYKEPQAAILSFGIPLGLPNSFPFRLAVEELRLSGAQLYREGIVTNDQILSKIKNGRQKPTKKAIDLFCQKYDVSAAWLYTGEGNMFFGRNKPFGPRVESADEKLLYNTDFDSCLDSNGQPIRLSYGSLNLSGVIAFSLSSLNASMFISEQGL